MREGELEHGIRRHYLGVRAEHIFIAEATKRGLITSVPQTPCHYDAIVDNGDKLWCVQVKATATEQSKWKDYDVYSINVSRMRHVNGWKGEYANHPYQEGDFDFMGVYIEPKNIWYIIPSAALDFTKTIFHLYFYPNAPEKNRGGRKFEEFKQAWGLLQ